MHQFCCEQKLFSRLLFCRRYCPAQMTLASMSAIVLHSMPVGCYNRERVAGDKRMVSRHTERLDWQGPGAVGTTAEATAALIPESESLRSLVQHTGAPFWAWLSRVVVTPSNSWWTCRKNPRGQWVTASLDQSLPSEFLLPRRLHSRFIIQSIQSATDDVANIFGPGNSWGLQFHNQIPDRVSC